MARVIKFCNMQAYQTGTIYSEIFDVTDVSRLDAELRVMTLTGTTPSPSITGTIQTTSDPSFDDGAWSPVGSTLIASTVTGVTGAYSGLGRFVRAKLVVAGTSGMVTACLQGVGRES